MGEMASSLAHELNQPLTSIYAYAQASLRMLQDGREKSEKFVNAIEQTAKRAEQAGEIIRRIRRFVRKEGIKKTRIKLNAVIEETLEFTKREIREKGITLQLDLEDQLPVVSVDGVQIQQVLLNLIRNSIEALGETKKPAITVSTQRVDDTHVRVTVRDSGPGLDKEQIDRIYDAFHTTKQNGMGMGLAISRSIIEAHNGRIWAESQTKQGAIFHFTLPITEE
jgi:signal transduction histidine kinase